jgi:LysR family transcriptional regulator, low CO2-responsive transcriptional regulator
MAGLGIALLSAHTVASELDDSRLVMLDVAGLSIMRQWFAVRGAGRKMMLAAMLLWEFFAARAAASCRPSRSRPRPLVVKTRHSDSHEQ